MIRLNGQEMRQKLEQLLAENGHQEAKPINGKHVNGKNGYVSEEE